MILYYIDLTHGLELVQTAKNYTSRPTRYQTSLARPAVYTIKMENYRGDHMCLLTIGYQTSIDCASQSCFAGIFGEEYV